MKIYHSAWCVLKEDPEFERLCREYEAEIGKKPWGGKPVYDESSVPVGRSLVVRDEGRLAGFATIRPYTQVEGSCTAIMDALYIEKSARKDGLVDKLVSEAQRTARDVYDAAQLIVPGDES